MVHRRRDIQSGEHPPRAEAASDRQLGVLVSRALGVRRPRVELDHFVHHSSLALMQVARIKSVRRSHEDSGATL